MSQRKWKNRVTGGRYRLTSNRDSDEFGRTGNARLPIVSLAVLPLVLVVGCAPGVAAPEQGPQTVTVTVTASPSATPPANSTAPTSAAVAPTVKLFCKVLDSNGLEYSVSTDGSTYNGSITVHFQDYPNSGHTFPTTQVTGATASGHWRAVPDEDIGGSAQPTTCTATAG